MLLLLLLLRNRPVGLCRRPLLQDVMGVQVGSSRVVSVRPVVAGSGSPGRVSVGRRSRGMGMLLVLRRLTGVHTVHPEGRRLSQASPVGGAVLGGVVRCGTGGTVSVVGHQVHYGVVRRRRWSSRGGTRRGVRAGGVQDVLVLLAEPELFLDPPLDVGVRKVVGDFPAGKGHFVVAVMVIGSRNSDIFFKVVIYEISECSE
mmetsp:Transcript_27190/g.63767  ORF Transcript_27190/g.63767 Transcript_27190/m.63767 type:complete len:201 (+) Transcript_27190:3146-3748(+)